MLHRLIGKKPANVAAIEYQVLDWDDEAKKWYCGDTPVSKDLQETLNFFGQTGWLVISFTVSPKADAGTIILAREKAFI